MGPVYAEAEIDAPREEIFEYLLDYLTRPVLFSGSTSDFRMLQLDPKGVGAGARFRFSRRGAWVSLAITDTERPTRISERGSTGRGNQTPAGMEWEITESESGLSQVKVYYWTSPSGIAAVPDRITGGAGWYGRLLKRVLVRLREEIEGGQEQAAALSVAGGNRFETGIP
jgi:uncharacterized protein YndB with AHSA1/START domain